MSTKKSEEYRELEEVQQYLYAEHIENGRSEKDLARELGLKPQDMKMILHSLGISKNKSGNKSKRPHGYWKDWDNVRRELEEAKRKLGHFPNHQELTELGLTSLSFALTRYHSGFFRAREIIDPESIRDTSKPKGYWEDWDNVVKEGRSLVEEFGYLPSKSEMEKLGRSTSMHSSVSQSGGTIRKLREALGLKQERNEPGHWDQFSRVKQRLEEIVEEIGHFPTQAELADLKEYGLIQGIGKWHGGLWAVTTRMGYEPPQVQRGFWKDWGTVKSKLEELAEKLGHFPTGDEVGEEDGGLLSAVEKYYGGINAVRERLGVPLERKSPGYWRDREIIFKEIREFMDKYRCTELPSATFVSEKGESSLLRAINKLGGFRAVREMLGGTNKTVEPGRWQDENYALDRAREVMERHGLDRLPSSCGLNELGYASLSAAISSHHGGFHSFRKKLGENDPRAPMGFWKDIDNVLDRLREVMERHGLDKVPSQNFLCNVEETTLAAAIREHGGLKKMKGLLGEEDPMDKRPERDELRRVYLDERRTLPEVGERYGVTPYIVKKWLREYEISPSERHTRIVPDENKENRRGYNGPTKEQLEQWYVMEQKTMKEIAESIGVSQEAIRKGLKLYEIPIVRRRHKNYPGEDKLREWYTDERQSAKEIAERLHVTAHSVRKWLIEAGIPIRGVAEANLGKDVRKPSEEQLREWYVDQGQTTVWIAEKVGVRDPTVGDWLREIGITPRDRRGIYDNRQTREETFREFLRLSGKEPSQVSLVDFYTVRREDGTRFSGLVGWYGRKHGVGHSTESKDYLLEDLCGIPFGTIPRKKARRVPRSELENWDNYKGRLDVMFGEHPELEGQLPSTTWMVDNGYMALTTAAKLYGGMNGVRKKLGQEVLRRGPEEIKDIEKITAELREVIENHREELEGEFPSQFWLYDRGYGHIVNAINRHHGGVSAMKARLGYKAPIRTQDQLVRFLEGSAEAREIGSLASVSEDISEVADILVKLWPERFPSAADLARSLPGAVGRIGHSLQPFSMDKARGLYEKRSALPLPVQYALEDLVYKIAVEQYQVQFSDNPRGVLDQLRGFAEEKNGISGLARKVLDYYQEIYNFSIPGHGRIGGED